MSGCHREGKRGTKAGTRLPSRSATSPIGPSAGGVGPAKMATPLQYDTPAVEPLTIAMKQ